LSHTAYRQNLGAIHISNQIYNCQKRFKSQKILMTLYYEKKIKKGCENNKVFVFWCFIIFTAVIYFYETEM
jgi:hypothetical protein